MQGALPSIDQAPPVSRPRAMMEQAELLYGDPATRPEALRLLARAGLAARNPGFATGALAELALIESWSDSDRLVAAQAALAERRFDVVRELSAEATGEIRVEFALVRAAAALARDADDRHHGLPLAHSDASASISATLAAMRHPGVE